LPHSQHRVLNAIQRCRTAALGGHREWCAQCGFERYAYNSCRNRHCPKCQTLVKAQWLEARQAELLPVPYFHNVFTLPDQLNLILCHERNQRALLNLLFQVAADTLLQFGRNHLGGTLGATMVLHTWDQKLRAHFHVHCLITGGVLSSDQQHWRKARPRFLFAVRALSKVFRGKFLAGLQKLYDTSRLQFPIPVAGFASAEMFGTLLRQLHRQGWVVYSKAPFAGPHKLLDYLGRYTHRVAIANNRLLAAEDGQVRFHYRDRADGDRLKDTSLSADKFIRRFLQHVLPRGFQRIRHYGLLAGRHKQEQLTLCRDLLGADPPPAPKKKTTADWLLRVLGIDVLHCPRCGQVLERAELMPQQRGPAAVALFAPEPQTKDTS
jgi:hypothetical protein